MPVARQVVYTISITANVWTQNSGRSKNKERRVKTMKRRKKRWKMYREFIHRKQLNFLSHCCGGADITACISWQAREFAKLAERADILRLFAHCRRWVAWLELRHVMLLPIQTSHLSNDGTEPDDVGWAVVVARKRRWSGRPRLPREDLLCPAILVFYSSLS